MKKGDSNQPVYVSETCWLYGEHDGLTVVAEDRSSNGTLHHVSQVTIPWAKVEKALAKAPQKSR